MEIYNVPEKGKLLYLNAQYFNNGRSRGVAEHVIKIQYKAKQGKKEQNFVMPLSTLVKEINRKARGKLSAEDAAHVKADCSGLKAQGKRFGFGFRQVTVVEKSKAGAPLIKRQQDCNVFCWVLFETDHIRLELSWRGETISIRIQGHKSALVPKQSMGIGYWDRKRDPELANRLTALAENSAARNAGVEPRTPETESSLRPEPVKVEIAEQPARLSPQKAPAKVLSEKGTSRKPTIAAADLWGVWQPESPTKIDQGLGWSVGLPDRLPLQAVEPSLGRAV
jgi:hypothetical protein